MNHLAIQVLLAAVFHPLRTLAAVAVAIVLATVAITAAIEAAWILAAAIRTRRNAHRYAADTDRIPPDLDGVDRLREAVNAAREEN